MGSSEGPGFHTYSRSGLLGGQRVIDGPGFREGSRSITDTDIQQDGLSPPPEQAVDVLYCGTLWVYHSNAVSMLHLSADVS